MKRNLILVGLVVMFSVTSVLAGCAQGKEQLYEPWNELAPLVAEKINVSESKVTDALEQAITKGIDTGETEGDVWPRLFGDIDINALTTWYADRPEGVTVGGLFSLKYYGVRIDMLSSGAQKLIDGIAENVASELGVNEQNLAEILQQALRDLANERHKEAIDEMVSDGYLTRMEADVYYQWFLQRPDFISPGRVGAID